MSKDEKRSKHLEQEIVMLKASMALHPERWTVTMLSLAMEVLEEKINELIALETD